MQVTSIQQLRQDSQGEYVKLPPFIQGSEFIAKLRRPSMMKLACNGRIPNQLLTRANELFSDGMSALNDTDNESMLQELGEVFEIFAESCFVEPTFQELKDNNIELTDAQLFFLLNYSQNGIQDLKPIDGAEENIGHHSNVQDV